MFHHYLEKGFLFMLLLVELPSSEPSSSTNTTEAVSASYLNNFGFFSFSLFFFYVHAALTNNPYKAKIAQSSENCGAIFLETAVAQCSAKKCQIKVKAQLGWVTMQMLLMCFKGRYLCFISTTRYCVF